VIRRRLADPRAGAVDVPEMAEVRMVERHAERVPGKKSLPEQR
jgi:hypothetical protein